ncbi:hypothetical protein AXF42_Ash017032 [Apostasia shenzhenica]|uniref:WIBG Mago-binding domain-containing protein n=1 Tax=Apostasia shenzhenica TaxID=1088818 RepID=A0A2I0B7G9_9ASPA|nr:hypothetical protein AXF42_Ash017032 [Apostasia shenzhenica]
MGEEQSTRLMRTPKEGERIIAPTRRPDGTLRKPIRIRAGYTPQDEVAIYQSKGTLVTLARRCFPLFLSFFLSVLLSSSFSLNFCLLFFFLSPFWDVMQIRKALESLPTPGYDPAADAKTKTKSAKRNERKKEKKLQAALATADEGKDFNSEEAAQLKDEEPSGSDQHRLDPVDSIATGISSLSVSSSTEKMGSSNPGESSVADIDKRIRAMKKKIRLAEDKLKGEQQDVTPDQSEKMAKIQCWRADLKILEDAKANQAT